MRIAVAGGTGTVGRHVVAHAQNAGHDVVVLSRSRGVDVRGDIVVGMDAETRVCEVCYKPANDEDGHVFVVIRTFRGESVPHRVHQGCVQELDAWLWRQRKD
jgi:nucleoside-diphosphate-sugar epimerase